MLEKHVIRDGAPRHFHNSEEDGKDSAVSPVIATILIMTIMVTAITAIMFWGNMLVLDMQTDANMGATLNYMKAINGGIRDVSDGGLGTGRNIHYSLSNGEASIKKDSSLWAVSYSTLNNDSVRFSNINDSSFQVDTEGYSDTARIYWTDSDMSQWWDDGVNTWQYRVPITVNSGPVYRDNEIVETNVNFRDLLDRFDTENGIDPGSIRVVEYDNDGNIIGEVPSETYGLDFATTVLRDTWDMENAADVQMWNGGFGTFTISGGILNTTLNAGDGYFCPLYSNIAGAPEIKTPFYSKITIRMYSSVTSDDGLAIMWEDQLGVQREQTKPIRTEAGWHTYTIDLNTAETIGLANARNGDPCTGLKWTDLNPTKLFIFPVNVAGANIKVDAVYLYKSSASVRFMETGITPPYTDKHYYLYFDTLENGPKTTNLTWAVYDNTQHYFLNKYNDVNITFHGNTPVLESIKVGSHIEVDAATDNFDQYLCNIIGTGITPLSTVSDLNVDKFHITSMRAVVEFKDLDIGGNLKANITYEMIKGSTYVNLYLDVWSTDDINQAVSMEYPLLMSNNGLEYTFYKDMYGNVSRLYSGGNFFPSYNCRWVQMYGKNADNLVMLLRQDDSFDANNLTMHTQDRKIIYDEQDPSTFSEKWGSNGFQGQTSNIRFSGVRSFAVTGGSDGWQPLGVDTSTYNYLTFAYQKTNPSDYFYLRFYVGGNWHEVTDRPTLTSDYDGWPSGHFLDENGVASGHITDTNWHQVIVPLSSEVTNGADESPFGPIVHESYGEGGFELDISGTGTIHYDAICFQQNALNNINGVSWNRYKSNWPDGEHEKRMLSFTAASLGSDTDTVDRKWFSSETPYPPVVIDKANTEFVPSRIYQLTQNPGVPTSTTINVDIPMSNGAHVIVSYGEQKVKEMYVYGIDSLGVNVLSPHGYARITVENGGIMTSNPTDTVIEGPAISMNQDANSIVFHMIELDSATASSVGSGDHVCKLSNIWQWQAMDRGIYFVRLYISGPHADAWYNHMITKYMTSAQMQYATDQDSFVSSSAYGSEYYYGILLRSVDIKGTPEDEGAYSISIIHTVVHIDLIEKNL